MKANEDNRSPKSIYQSEIAKGINEMLDCLLSQGDIGCKKCKQCEKVDACCFLTDSVFVYKNMNDIKIQNTLL